jgi:hypothetical protein
MVVVRRVQCRRFTVFERALSIHSWHLEHSLQPLYKGGLVCVGTRREPQPTPTPAEMADFVASLTRHLQWQREQLRLGKDAQHRFLILRPGERYLVCSPGGMTRLATHNTTLAGCISLSRFVTKHPAW